MIDQLKTNLASIDVDLDDAALAELDAFTKPNLNHAGNVLSVGAGFRKGSCTINGVRSEMLVR